MKTKFIIYTCILVLLQLSTVHGDCCKRKPNGQCCGNGKCNIFCCNCDDGCNVACETNCCDTAEWLSCAGTFTECGIQCAANPSLCASCLGGVGSTCYKCYFNCKSTQMQLEEDRVEVQDDILDLGSFLKHLNMVGYGALSVDKVIFLFQTADLDRDETISTKEKEEFKNPIWLSEYWIQPEIIGDLEGAYFLRSGKAEL